MNSTFIQESIGPRMEEVGAATLRLPSTSSLEGPTLPTHLPAVRIVRVMLDEKRASDDDMVLLRQGIWVRRDFHDAIFVRVKAAIRRLPFGRELKVDDFFDPAYWNSKPNEHWRIGCCLSHWVWEGTCR